MEKIIDEEVKRIKELAKGEVRIEFVKEEGEEDHSEVSIKGNAIGLKVALQSIIVNMLENEVIDFNDLTSIITFSLIEAGINPFNENKYEKKVEGKA